MIKNFLNNVLLKAQKDKKNIKEDLETVLDNKSNNIDGISKQERIMLMNILKIDKILARDIMIPRAEIIAVDENILFEEAIKIFVDGAHSRIPIYKEQLDNITGMLHIKDLIKFQTENQNKEKFIDNIKKDILHIPPSMPVLDLLIKMQLTRLHMGLVIDEYGGVDGLITIEDVIEQIKINLDKSFGNNFDFRRVENVGPKVSAELLKSGIIAISVALALMLIYIWIRFEWQFSLGAILALFHDVIVTLGLFSLFGLEINLSIIAAVLTIVGYSMNDTVVIFDRVRENLKRYSDIKIYELTNISINETLSRTLITSITTLLALLSIFFFGGEILKGFSLAMIFGVVFGTYSSIYIANTVLVRLNVSQKTVLREEDKN